MAESDSGRRVFLDSNIWLYALVWGKDLKRSYIAWDLVKRQEEQALIVTSVQVVNEVCFNLKRKAKVCPANSFPDSTIGSSLKPASRWRAAISSGLGSTLTGKQ